MGALHPGWTEIDRPLTWASRDMHSDLPMYYLPLLAYSIFL
jgi:hypothetical protein